MRSGGGERGGKWNETAFPEWEGGDLRSPEGENREAKKLSSSRRPIHWRKDAIWNCLGLMPVCFLNARLK